MLHLFLVLNLFVYSLWFSGLGPSSQALPTFLLDILCIRAPPPIASRVAIPTAARRRCFRQSSSPDASQRAPAEERGGGRTTVGDTALTPPRAAGDDDLAGSGGCAVRLKIRQVL